MKLNKTNLSIVISSIALVMVLIIQVNWIFKTAQIKEQLFNEKANMVLSRTMEELGNDQVACGKINACVSADDSKEGCTSIGQNETKKIDSLFNAYMDFYNFHIDYKFEVVKPTYVASTEQKSFTNHIFNQPMNNGGQSGFELKLIFPSKRQYILAEMGPMFIMSVLLILVVMVMFWRTIASLKKEKEISEHTTDFLNNMTHEFKTPLTNIALAGKMINKGTALENPDKVSHYSGIILEENEKLKMQVEQMLSMTALERGELPLIKTTFDIHELIRDVLKSFGVQIENIHGDVQMDLKASISMVNGDKIHLTGMVTNLLDNAIKYSKDKPVISIKTFNEADQFVFVISDNGIGIDKEYQKKVFDKFFRVPTGDVHNVKGYGLGLAYIKKIVELHKGRIILTSQKEMGTSFTIHLPHA